MIDKYSRNLESVHRREINEGSEERVLNIATRILTDSGHPLTRRSRSFVKCRKKRGIFHTCEIIFWINHESSKGPTKTFINVRYCGHFGIVIKNFACEVADNKLFKEQTPSLS